MVGVQSIWAHLSGGPNYKSKRKFSRDLQIPQTGPRTPTHPSDRGPVNFFDISGNQRRLSSSMPQVSECALLPQMAGGL